MPRRRSAKTDSNLLRMSAILPIDRSEGSALAVTELRHWVSLRPRPAPDEAVRKRPMGSGATKRRSATYPVYCCCGSMIGIRSIMRIVGIIGFIGLILRDED